MFTGLVEGVGRVVSLARQGSGGVIGIDSPIVSDAGVGDSIAVDGVCLTVTALDGPRALFDVSAETLARTTLGERRAGDPVNLERALRLGDRLGGHLVTGHVDCVGRVAGRRREGGTILFTIQLPAGTGRYVVEKGSVAVDGISLTVNGVRGDTFTLTVIPHTGRETTIWGRGIGERVNVEFDVIGKYVERLLGRHEGEKAGLGTLLAEYGYL